MKWSKKILNIVDKTRDMSVSTSSSSGQRQTALTTAVAQRLSKTPAMPMYSYPQRSMLSQVREKDGIAKAKSALSQLTESERQHLELFFKGCICREASFIHVMVQVKVMAFMNLYFRDITGLNNFDQLKQWIGTALSILNKLKTSGYLADFNISLRLIKGQQYVYLYLYNLTKARQVITAQMPIFQERTSKPDFTVEDFMNALKNLDEPVGLAMVTDDILHGLLLNYGLISSQQYTRFQHLKSNEIPTSLFNNSPNPKIPELSADLPSKIEKGSILAEFTNLKKFNLPRIPANSNIKPLPPYTTSQEETDAIQKSRLNFNYANLRQIKNKPEIHQVFHNYGPHNFIGAKEDPDSREFMDAMIDATLDVKSIIESPDFLAISIALMMQKA